VTRQFAALSDPDSLVAVVGATDSPGKYGGIIYRDLKSRGHRVVAVNPNRSTVDGDPAYPNLSSLPERPDIVNVVVGPQDGLGIVAEWARLEGTSIWFQPGSHDGHVLDAARGAGMDVIDGNCIMVVDRLLATSA